MCGYFGWCGSDEYTTNMMNRQCVRERESQKKNSCRKLLKVFFLFETFKFIVLILIETNYFFNPHRAENFLYSQHQPTNTVFLSSSLYRKLNQKQKEEEESQFTMWFFKLTFQ